jgi:glycosyltransferase involved in cell wall biosynthesis
MTTVTHDSVYATSGWGVHDERWVTALLEVGLTPHVVSLGRDAADPLELRLAVEEAADGGLPVLAGPLDTVTRHLIDLPVRLVGLSWGYDLDRVAPGEQGWLRQLNGLIVDSRPNQRLAVEAGVDPGRVTFLPWGVDLATFAFHGPWIDAFRLGVPPHAHLVLSLRAHEPQYRIDDIVDAFASIPRRPGLHEDFPDPYLIIGHSGSGTPELRERADHLGVSFRVRFVDSVPEHDLVHLLGRAACYVTAAEVDGTSVTLLQAMACGTPVIASDIPGNRAWIEDGVTGFLFPTGDTAALATLIDRVCHRYPTEVTERARALVEREADWHANLPRLRTALDRA